MQTLQLSPQAKDITLTSNPWSIADFIAKFAGISQTKPGIYPWNISHKWLPHNVSGT